MDVIADGGIAKASMARIAERAGVSVGVISYHFGNKAGLIEAVVDSVAQDAVAVMEPQIVAQPTAARGLRTLIVSNLEFLRDNANGFRALLEIIQNDPAVYAVQGGKAVTDVEKVLAWGHRTGEFRDFDTRVMAIAIRSAIDAVAHLAGSGIRVDIDRYAAELSGLFDRATRKDG